MSVKGAVVSAAVWLGAKWLMEKQDKLPSLPGSAPPPLPEPPSTKPPPPVQRVIVPSALTVGERNVPASDVQIAVPEKLAEVLDGVAQTFAQGADEQGLVRVLLYASSELASGFYWPPRKGIEAAFPDGSRDMMYFPTGIRLAEILAIAGPPGSVSIEHGSAFGENLAQQSSLAAMSLLASWRHYKPVGHGALELVRVAWFTGRPGADDAMSAGWPAWYRKSECSRWSKAVRRWSNALYPAEGMGPATMPCPPGEL